MTARRAYRTHRRSTRSEATRAKIIVAVRDLLAEGKFHEATVDEVADRAGIARATLYQHFRSRLELVDAMCDTFDENPALVSIRKGTGHPARDPALDLPTAGSVDFWPPEAAVLAQIYGVAAIDPAAADLVDRQRVDRRNELGRLIAHLHAAGRLRPGVSKRQAL